MLTYGQFKLLVLERFSEAFPDADVHISPVTKNNQTVFDGLIVMIPGSNISPTIYLNQAYDIYCESGDFERVCYDLFAVYQECRITEPVDLDFLSDFSRIRSYLFCRLISAGRNEQLLKNVPHRMFLDLAEVYYLGLSSSRDTRASILVTNSQMDDWGITEADLQEIALENNRTKYPSELISLSRFLTREGSDLHYDSDSLPLYILTNSARFYGASALLDASTLQRFAAQAGDFYILPSSLHEVLLISREAAPGPEVLNKIIHEVNSSHLDPQDVLSDHLYTYSVQTQSIH